MGADRSEGREQLRAPALQIDLIAMKVAAGRPQDELDITSLHRARGA